MKRLTPILVSPPRAYLCVTENGSPWGQWHPPTSFKAASEDSISDAYELYQNSALDPAPSNPPNSPWRAGLGDGAFYNLEYATCYVGSQRKWYVVVNSLDSTESHPKCDLLVCDEFFTNYELLQAHWDPAGLGATLDHICTNLCHFKTEEAEGLVSYWTSDVENDHFTEYVNFDGTDIDQAAPAYNRNLPEDGFGTETWYFCRGDDVEGGSAKFFTVVRTWDTVLADGTSKYLLSVNGQYAGVGLANPQVLASSTYDAGGGFSTYGPPCYDFKNGRLLWIETEWGPPNDAGNAFSRNWQKIRQAVRIDSGDAWENDNVTISDLITLANPTWSEILFEGDPEEVEAVYPQSGALAVFFHEGTDTIYVLVSDAHDNESGYGGLWRYDSDGTNENRLNAGRFPNSGDPTQPSHIQGVALGPGCRRPWEL